MDNINGSYSNIINDKTNLIINKFKTCNYAIRVNSVSGYALILLMLFGYYPHLSWPLRIVLFVYILICSFYLGVLLKKRHLLISSHLSSKYNNPSSSGAFFKGSLVGMSFCSISIMLTAMISEFHNSTMMYNLTGKAYLRFISGLISLISLVSLVNIVRLSKISNEAESIANKRMSDA